jgi:hypothetical protein
MRADVFCSECGTVLDSVEAPTFGQLWPRFATIVARAHATKPEFRASEKHRRCRFPHGLEFRLDLEARGPFETTGECVCRCLQPNCSLADRERTYNVPPEWVPAAALLFHASHEGHPFEVTYEGHVIGQSPVTQSERRAGTRS